MIKRAFLTSSMFAASSKHQEWLKTLETERDPINGKKNLIDNKQIFIKPMQKIIHS